MVKAKWYHCRNQNLDRTNNDIKVSLWLISKMADKLIYDEVKLEVKWCDPELDNCKNKKAENNFLNPSCLNIKLGDFAA